MNTKAGRGDITLRKRRRVYQACDACRQAKFKCDGSKPSCQKCQQAKRPCFYGAPARKRGLRTGYVRALECLWGLTFSTIEGSESAVQKLLLEKPGWSAWIRDETDERHRDESPVRTWRSSLIPQILDSLLEKNGTEGRLDLPRAFEGSSAEDLSWTSQSMHVSSDRSQSRIPPAGEKLDDENINTGSSRNKAASINPKVHTLTNPAGKTAMPHPPTPELPQNAHQLLNQFFSSTQPWMPIFQRHSVYRTLSEYRQHCLNSEAPTDLRTGENSLLWAIFAHSTTSPLFFDDTKKVMTQPPSQSAGEIYRIARGMIPAEDENKYTTGHVQAFLVLALTQYCSHQWSIASLITGQAILAARHIGLDKSVLKTEERKYTWLGCFAIDTLVSLHTGQTPHLRPSQIRTFFPLDTAKNEEWEPWHLQQALLPGVGAEVAEFPEPTHAISMFSQQLEILCLANDWIRANADGRALGNIKDSFLCWNLRLPDDVTYFSTTVDDLSATPSNIIHLQVLQAFLYTRLWNSHPFDCSNELCSMWIVALDALECFLKCFHQATLPPSCNLIRDISWRPSQCRTLPILAVTRQLKADILGYVTLSKEGSDEFPFLGALDKNPNTALASCQLDSSIQQDFDWLDGVPHPWSWSQPTASSLRLYPNELFDNLSTTGMPSTFTHTAGPSEYGHLEYSSGAEEAEE